MFLILATSLSALYSTLDPTSVSQHFAFYELYPKTQEGKKALVHAWDLLSGGATNCDPELMLPSVDPQQLISFVNRVSPEATVVLNEEQLAVIDKLSSHLHNRKLKGHEIWDLETLHKLPAEDIDISRGLLLAEMGTADKLKIRSYEATMDLMALQILARLPENATPEEKVRAFNDYIFSELHFRFPRIRSMQKISTSTPSYLLY